MLFIEPMKTHIPIKMTIHRKHIIYRREDIIARNNTYDTMLREPVDGMFIYYYISYLFLMSERGLTTQICV